jgi:ribonuclease P protein component
VQRLGAARNQPAGRRLDGLMPRAPRRARLSRSAEFERVYRQGRSLGNRHLVLYAFPTATSERPRLGLSVSRKVGGAVHRNRVKRLLREAFAKVEPQLTAGQDLVIVARPEVRDLAEREGLDGVDHALADLLDRAGLRGTPAGRGNGAGARAALPDGEGVEAGNGGHADEGPAPATGDEGDAASGDASGDAP